MVKKKYLSKLFLVGVMCMSLITPMLSSVSTYADTNSTGNVNSVGSEIGDTNESAVGKDVTQGKKTEYQDGVTGTNHTEIYMTVASQFDVVIPKTVILDGVGKVGAYSIKLDGDIPGTAKITVVPDATSTLHSEGKDDIIAEISQVQTEWVNSNLSQVATGTITANGATAGVWKGDLNFNINYDGEGGSGDAHIHNWAESITKEATCTTTGVKTFTCSCGATKTQTIPAKGHNYVNGVCSNCGVEQICSHVDDDNNHLCDKCGQVISSHVDSDKNHNCDTCGVAMSEHTDADNDSVCDYCGTTVCEHVDTNNDHNCDKCGAKMSDHVDADNNHNCDICGEKMSEHVDANKDHNCDVCGDKISDHVDANGDGICDDCGNEIHVHTYVSKSSAEFSGYSTVYGSSSNKKTVRDNSSSNTLQGTMSGLYASGNSATGTGEFYTSATLTILDDGDYSYSISGGASPEHTNHVHVVYGSMSVSISPKSVSDSSQGSISIPVAIGTTGAITVSSSAPEKLHLAKGTYNVRVKTTISSGATNVTHRLYISGGTKEVCSGCGEVKSSN